MPTMATSAGASFRRVDDAPATFEFGFSTRCVVEGTAEVVGDLLPYDRQVVRVWGAGRPDWWYVNTRGEARSYEVVLSGGSIEFDVTVNRQGAASTGEWRDTDRTRNAQLQADLWPDDDDESDELLPRRGVIREWSAASRRRMIKAIADLDHDSWAHPEWRLAMVTLTVPGDWQSLFPKGEDFKAAFDRFRLRWLRRFGSWQVVWKLEFQDRGAPHIHFMVRVPNGTSIRPWLSKAWADSVGATGDEYRRHLGAGTNIDFGFRGTDPQRIAVYFLKHSSKTHDGKEYQHRVPAEWWPNGHGPGRFWGICGLERLAERVELSESDWFRLRRIMAHVHRSRRAAVALRRRSHVVGGVSEATRRATLEDLRPYGMRRDRVLRSALGGGWIIANDAPALLYRAAHFLSGTPPLGTMPE